jgi:Tfp pilus assembly protein PilV
MMKIIHKKSAAGKRSGEAGFSLVEVLFAAVILMVGLLSMVAVFGYAIAATQTVQEDQIAKQKAQEMITTGEAAIRAAEARNVDQLFTAGGDIYVSTDFGVSKLSNGSTKWVDAAPGMPAVSLLMKAVTWLSGTAPMKPSAG